MKKLQIVTSRRDIRRFVYFPKKLYADSTHWVPPLWFEELRAYNTKNNPILTDSEFSLNLVLENGEVMGRNLVYIDKAFNRYYKTKTGFYGAFESVDDAEVSALLLDSAEEWLSVRGMDSIRGPIHPVAECWGFLREGYDKDPVYMAPYNYPYYHRLVEQKGYRKVKDLLAYEANAREGYEIPERFLRFSEKILRRKKGLSLRRINLDRLVEDAEWIWKIINASLANNWGYVPVGREVMLDLIRRLKLILDPDAIWFVEDKGIPVACALGFPDINTIIKKIDGRLFPFGFIRLLRGAKKAQDYRLFGLAVMPSYHSIGLDALLYVNICRALKPKNIRLEANYILEDNYNIKNALEKLDLELVNSYRIYEKTLT